MTELFKSNGQNFAVDAGDNTYYVFKDGTSMMRLPDGSTVQLVRPDGSAFWFNVNGERSEPFINEVTTPFLPEL